MELVDYILPLILEREVRGYDSYQRAVPLRAEEGTQAGYLLGNTSSGVQGQPSFTELEVSGLTLGQMAFPVKVVVPVFTNDLGLMGLISSPSQLEVGRGVKVLLGGCLPSLSPRILAWTSLTSGESLLYSSN